jgi:hypothetical protein
MSDLRPYEDALARWIHALGSRGQRPSVEAAVGPGIRLERYGFGDSRGQLVQIFEGPGPVAAWLAMTPPEVEFAAEGDLTLTDDGVATTRYRMTAGTFVNGGEWRFRLAADGRILWLAHRPDSLPEDPQAQLARLGSQPLPVRPNPLPPHPHAHPHPHPHPPDSSGEPDQD